MREILAQSASRLDDILENAGINVMGGTSLFRYCEHLETNCLFEHLGRNGILVRPFEEQPYNFRVGLPGDENQWARLICVLKTS